MTALFSIRKHPVVTVAVTLIAAVLVGWWLNPWQADAAGETESVLTPITPCRAVDTREAIGLDRTTKLGEGEAVNVSFAGGVGGCVLPDNITAVSANIFAVAPTATSPVSFFTVGPADEELSTTSVLNFNNQLAVFGNEIRIPLSADGAATIFNAFGNVHLVADINGFYTPTPTTGGGDGAVSQSVLDRLNALEVADADKDQLIAAQANRIADLEALLAGVERAPDDNGYDTITFTGVNLQLVDGTGDTYDTPSGLGNLIIGYNEPTNNNINNESRDGAHNLIIGDHHSYGDDGIGDHAAGGIVAGTNSAIGAPGASVTGGQGNTADGNWASVTGGISNNADESYASVTGGEGNTASGSGSSITGGHDNTASGPGSSITGGHDNTASGSGSTVTGGDGNVSVGTWSVVIGGSDNTAGGALSVAVGGLGNDPASETSVVVGGDNNSVAVVAPGEVIVGGDNISGCEVGDVDQRGVCMETDIQADSSVGTAPVDV